MNKKNYIDKIELILNTSGKYITRKEKDMILDYVNYFKTKNNVIEDKNIELVIEIEKLDNDIKELLKENENKEKVIKAQDSIIKEVREEVRIYEEQSNDGATNELDNYVFVQRLKNVLDKGE